MSIVCNVALTLIQALATVSSHIMKDSQVVGFLKNETSEVSRGQSSVCVG